MGFFYRDHRRIAFRRWGAKRPRGRILISEEGGVQMLQLFTGFQTWWAELKERASEERGATAVEYALMVALIAVVIILAVTFLGTSARDKFQEVGDAVANSGT
jgi:pilus assembly protein Flp/PilA